jgi:DNA-binding MarR family transcriptional regulator
MDLLGYEIKRAHWGMVMVALRRFRAEAVRRPELEWMTPARFDVLLVTLQRALALGAKPGSVHLISLGELIMKLVMDKTTIARTVRMMEVRGLLKRSRDVKDRRLTIVTLTALGITAARTVLELLRGEPNFIFERIRYWLDDEEKERPPQKDGAAQSPTAVPAPPTPPHRAHALRIRKLARLFDRWSYPVYLPEFNPRAEYTMGWPEPPPEFATAPTLPPARPGAMFVAR